MPIQMEFRQRSMGNENDHLGLHNSMYDNKNNG